MFGSRLSIDVSVMIKMKKIENRAVIKYLSLKGNTPMQIKDALDAVYGDTASSFLLVKYWAAEFKRRVAAWETQTFRSFQNCNHRRKHRSNSLNSAGKSSSMSQERVCHVLNQNLTMKKLTARWVPRLVTLVQKSVQMNIYNDLLAQFKLNKSQ